MVRRRVSAVSNHVAAFSGLASFETHRFAMLLRMRGKAGYDAAVRQWRALRHAAIYSKSLLRMVGMRSLSSGAHSRDPLALPILSIATQETS
jgi:hypothetical protein